MKRKIVYLTTYRRSAVTFLFALAVMGAALAGSPDMPLIWVAASASAEPVGEP